MNIFLDIKTLEMPSPSQCAHNSFTVYDGTGTMSPRLAVVCQSLSDKHLLSSGDTMFITTHFDYLGRQSFYFFAFSSVKVNNSCGGILEANSSTNNLTTPGFPRSYSNLEACEWTIQSQNMSDTILINVRSMRLQHSTCSSNVLKIFLQKDTYNELLIKNICSSTTSTFQVQSPGNTISLRFKTDNELVDEGFQLTYRAVPATLCNVVLMASNTPSYVYSPGYPDSYERNLSCHWGIFSEDRTMRIQVTVQLENDVENCSSTDVLNLFDSSFSLQQIVLCSNTNPANITVYESVRNPLLIAFNSGRDELGPAFRLSYQQVPAPATIHPVFPTHPPHCRDTYLTAAATEQYISSPGYPNQYFSNLRCVWNITAPHGKMIHIRVVSSDVEYSERCRFDKVEAFDGATIHSSILETWCGDRTPTFQSTGNAMLLIFRTDGSRTGSGFRLKYSMTDTPFACTTNVTVTRTTTMIYSPMYPVRYPRNENCTWYLTTNYGSNIELNVRESRLQSSHDCTLDYIAIYDGSKEIGSFCENKFQTYVSSGRKMTIIFYAKSFGGSGIGFKLAATGGHYKVCGHSSLSAYESSSHDLTSPRYPLSYPNNADCTWVISTYLYDHFIILEVVESDIEFSAGCMKDYLEAFDGVDTFARSLGRWCGTTTPTKKSSSGSMTVLFHTDESYTKSGFKITYYASQNNKDDDGFNAAAMWGGLAGGGFLLAIVILCGRAYKKRTLAERAQRDERRRPAYLRESVGQLSTLTPDYTVGYSQQQVSIQPENTGEYYNAAVFDLPPSYDEVIKNNTEFQVPPSDNSVPDSCTTNGNTADSQAHDTRL